MEPVSKLRRRMEHLLWLTGALCAVVLCVAGVEANGAQRAASRIGPGSVAAGGVEVSKDSSAAVIARLDIPQISLSVPVMSNFESNSLLRGVGHIEGTAMPGGLGTMGLAGHRDTYFRPLRRIAIGMEIRVTDASGTYHYRVDSTQIVTPDRVEVLNIQNRPEMALVTCYPFDFVGAAPKRFIVHAHLLSVSPDVAQLH